MREVVRDVVQNVVSNVGIGLRRRKSGTTPIPVLVSAEIQNSYSGYTVISFTPILDIAIEASAPIAFSCLVNGTENPVVGIAVDEDGILWLALTNIVSYGDIVTITYTKPEENPLKGIAGGEVASFTDVAVVNNIEAPIPVLVSATIEDAAPDELQLAYDIALNETSVPAPTDYEVLVNNIEVAVTNITISGTNVTLTLASDTVYGDVVTFIYHKGVNPLQGLDGGEVTNGTVHEVTNNIAFDEVWYGYELNEANSSPDVTRIAGANSMSLHASLPVHSEMKACLLNDDGTVNYYLKADDWTKKASGADSNLDGTDGQVMIEVPRFYHKIENPSAGVYQHKISQYAITEFTEIPKFYIAAYEAALNRSTSKLASVKNLTTNYRGGNNNAAWDAANNTLLGKPATSISLTNFRTYARNRNADTKWNVLPWRQAMLIYDLFIIEYATRNSQKAVNANLTVNGYRQGGLGNGVSTAVSAEWNTFSSYYPFVSCGASDSLANGTGEVPAVKANFGGAGVNRTFTVPRYRGIENVFGHIWEWNDGASIFHQTDGAGGLSKFYTCDSPANFADGTASNYEHRSNLPRGEGYLKTVTHDAKGIMIPREVAGGSTTYFADYFYTPGGSGAWVALLRDGFAIVGAFAGFVCLYSSYAASTASASIGARLCYIP